MPTKINWTNETWNPVTGCSKISAARKFCYAEREWARLSANSKTVYFGRKFTEVKCHPERLDQPLRWTRPRMIFVNSMSDLFHQDVPDDFLPDVIAVMAASPQHTFQILTKRPERMREVLNDGIFFEAVVCSAKQYGMLLTSVQWPLKNVWLGVSVEDQKSADLRIPLLLETPVAVRWISAEPLLGNIDIVPYMGWRSIKCNCGSHHDEHELLDQLPENEICTISVKKTTTHPTLDWVVVGGESGPSARPMHPDWTHAIKEQCQETNTPFFFKQWGEWVGHGINGFGTHPGQIAWINSTGEFLDPPPLDEDADCLTIKRVGKKVAGRLLGGHLYDEYPVRKI